MRTRAIIWSLAVLAAKSRSDDTLRAVVIPASQYFEGNDGPWSTFDVRVGTPEQYLRVLVSTASPETMVALSDLGCSTSVFTTVPSDCAVSRGNLFILNQSSSWQDVGTYGINQNGVGLEANLGYTQRAQWGFEHLGIGLNGPSLENQTVAGIATAKPFYLGIFGLNNQPVNFTSLGNHSSPSFINTLKEQKKIPSISWSYTAGAKYRLKQVYGQLIFSGYDTSRFTENSVSFTMADDITRDLVVALHSISYSGSNAATLLSTPIDIYIDSTDPNLWLPGDVCDAFEKAFGLTLDSKSGLYLVDETQHNTLLNSNAQVSFRLSDVKSGGETVTITLPYAAFDLTAQNPLVDSTSHYFPLKRANSSAQYTLGRTFLQEAYLTADYERKVFNVSACVWNEGATENIITITQEGSSSNTVEGGQSPSGSSGSSGLSRGAIAGIAVGSSLAGLILIAAVAFVLLRKRRKWMQKGFVATSTVPQPDESVLNGPVFNSTGRSPADGSTPMTAADVSAARSTAEYSRSAADSPLQPVTVGENVELDGRDTAVRPNKELDGHEIVQTGKPVAQNPGVYELPGSAVAGGGTEPDRAPSTVGALPSRREVGGGNESPPSPFTSTMGTTWGQEETDDSHVVSPTSSTRPGPRLF